MRASRLSSSRPLALLCVPAILASCIPEEHEVSREESTAPVAGTNPPTYQTQASYPGTNAPPAAASSTSLAQQDILIQRLTTQANRISRLETELHEMRLLFTSQLQRIEEVANQSLGAYAQSYAATHQQPQPQQVVIMPQTPVVTHRWDQVPATQSLATNTTPSYYQVQAGDTLSEIAERFGLPLSNVMGANPSLDPRRLQIGSRVSLPAYSATPSTNRPAALANRGGNHAIQSGDTLSQLAEHYGISLQNLLAANPGIKPERLQLGQNLRIPARNSALGISQRYGSAPLPAPAPDPITPTTYPPTPTSTRQPSQTLPSVAPPPSAQAASLDEKILIRLSKPTTLGELAEKLHTNVETLNRLNAFNLTSSFKLSKGGTIFVPNPDLKR